MDVEKEKENASSSSMPSSSSSSSIPSSLPWVRNVHHFFHNCDDIIDLT